MGTWLTPVSSARAGGYARHHTDRKARSITPPPAQARQESLLLLERYNNALTLWYMTDYEVFSPMPILCGDL